MDVKAIFEKHGFEYVAATGAGASGSVFLVRSEQYQQLFVIKRIAIKESHISPLAEAKALAKLNHPNIIKMYSSFVECGHIFMVLEYCEGGSLKDWLETRGPLNDQKLVKFAKQLAAAIKYCHSHNIAHRDIKPANLLLDGYGRLKLADFGLSEIVEKFDDRDDKNNRDDKNDRDDMNIKYKCGSPMYMSPEIFSKSEYDVFKADIWAFGVTLYQLKTNLYPWINVVAAGELDNIEVLKKHIVLGIEYRDPAIGNDLFQLLKGMICPKLKKRWTIDKIIQSQYFRNESTALNIKQRKSDMLVPSIVVPYLHSRCSKLKSVSPLAQDSAMNHFKVTQITRPIHVIGERRGINAISRTHSLITERCSSDV